MSISTVKWTAEKIARFWSEYEDRPGMQNWHFSKQRGSALISFTRKKISLSEPVLDLGCGSGHLTALLLSHGYKVFGADVSDRAREIVTERFKGIPDFLGFKHIQSGNPLPFENGSVKTIFCLETVEHLLSGDLDNLLKEIRRILVNGGHLIVTAPNNEILQNSFVQCEKCAARFHSIQHIRSFTSDTLGDLLANAGFNQIICRPAVLLPEWNVWFAAQRAKGITRVPCPECGTQVAVPPTKLQKRLKSLFSELLHLVCIVTKTGD